MTDDKETRRYLDQINTCKIYTSFTIIQKYFICYGPKKLRYLLLCFSNITNTLLTSEGIFDILQDCYTQ